VVGGAASRPEFLTVLFGLMIYTAGYIAEVVRAGIQSVPTAR
jgi:general L-amino acid transport system permease protein